MLQIPRIYIRFLVPFFFTVVIPLMALFTVVLYTIYRNILCKRTSMQTNEFKLEKIRNYLHQFYFSARTGSRTLQSLTPEERAASVNNLADLLITKQSQILEANAKDLEEGTKSGLAKPLLSRLSLTPAKLKNLSIGLRQIADSSLQVMQISQTIDTIHFIFIVYKFTGIP